MKISSRWLRVWFAMDGFIRFGRSFDAPGMGWKTVWHRRYFSERNGLTKWYTVWPMRVTFFKKRRGDK